nr:DUF21 domain-containing protein [candidate division Zixibacteria bacterium]
MELITVVAIILCLIQSGIFSGLNLAVFSITRLRLEIESESGNEAARRVLNLRRDTNLTLTTILWGNVAVNTLLAILSNSILTGLGAFIFSTVVITFIGEILPQAYFSRHALRIASRLYPVLKFYRFLLYPLAKPSSMILDSWLGPEGVHFLRERHLLEMIKRHIDSDESDVDRLEGIGALNFLVFDDLAISEEGEPIDTESVICLHVEGNRPVFPKFDRSPEDIFLQQVESSGKKWVILTDPGGDPLLVLDSDGFLRAALFGGSTCNPYDYCHRPIIVRQADTELGEVVWRLKVEPKDYEDDVIDKDIILLWGDDRRIITGADILGRLLRGIVIRDVTRGRSPGPGHQRQTGEDQRAT